MNLHEYKEIVGTSAVVTTMGQMLAGTLICRDVCKKGTTEGIDPVPFVGGVVMYGYTYNEYRIVEFIWSASLLMLRYAFILNEPAMININVFGLLINLAYVSVFYAYAPSKRQTLGMFGKALAFAAICLGYSQLENSDDLRFRFGILVTILLLSLIASPLLHLSQVLRTKSTAILPFPLIFMGTIVSLQWLLYGFIIDDAFTINAVGFALNALQLSLFAIFPSAPGTSDPKKSK